MLLEDGRIMVLDWGLVNDPSTEDADESQRLTSPGIALGSPIHMAPEEITMGKFAYTMRSEVYTCASTLYELLAQKTAYPSDLDKETLMILKVLNTHQIEPLHQLNPEIHYGIGREVAKAMSHNQKDRHKDVTQFVNSLTGYSEKNKRRR